MPDSRLPDNDGPRGSCREHDSGNDDHSGVGHRRTRLCAVMGGRRPPPQDVLREEELQGARLRLDGVRSRLNRLTDAFIDGMLEKSLFEARKNALIIEEQEIRETIQRLENGNGQGLRRLEEFLELIKNAPFLYKNASPDEKRDLARNLFSNLKLVGKNLRVEPKPSVQVLTNRQKIPYGAPSRGVHRTWNAILNTLLEQFSETSTTPAKALSAAAQPLNLHPSGILRLENVRLFAWQASLCSRRHH